jgi:hypothetical protein
MENDMRKLINQVKNFGKVLVNEGAEIGDLSSYDASDTPSSYDEEPYNKPKSKTNIDTYGKLEAFRKGIIKDFVNAHGKNVKLPYGDKIVEINQFGVVLLHSKDDIKYLTGSGKLLFDMDTDTMIDILSHFD